MSQEINLYQPHLRPNRDVLTGRHLGGALLVVVAFVVAFGVVARIAAERSSAELQAVQSEQKTIQEKLAAQSKKLAERQVSAALKAEIDGAKAQLASRQAVMALLDSGRLGNSSGFSAVLSGFSRLASDDLWLTAFAVSAGGQEIEIRGRLLDSSKLPAYVQRLGGEAAFAGRRFATLDVRRGDEDGAAAGDAKPASGATSPASPRYLEFTLRSENAGDPATAAGGKK